MEYLYAGLALLGAILSFRHYKKSKQHYRTIKLSYAINLFLIFGLEILVILGFDKSVTQTASHAVFGLLLLTIVGGEIVSSVRSGITVIPTFGYEFKVEKKTKE